MNYNEACNILGVNKKDTLEDIKKKYRELATKYHPDINKEKDATEKTQQINLAFEFICKNYNNRKIEFCKLSYEEFMKKYKRNGRIIYYLQCLHMSFGTLYYKYSEYFDACTDNNVQPQDLFSWLKDYESGLKYANIASYETVHYIYTAYIITKSFVSKTFTEYVLDYISKAMKSHGYNINPFDLSNFIDEYLASGVNITFNEWLNQKIKDNIINRININIDNIIRSGGFNGVTDADVYEILVFITGKTIFDYRYYPPKNINTLKLILAYVAKQNSNIVLLANLLNSNIETLVESYFNSKYRYSATFNDYLVALSKIALDEKSDNVDNVNRIVKEISYSKKQI